MDEQDAATFTCTRCGHDLRNGFTEFGWRTEQWLGQVTDQRLHPDDPWSVEYLGSDDGDPATVTTGFQCGQCQRDLPRRQAVAFGLLIGERVYREPTYAEAEGDEDAWQPSPFSTTTAS